MIMSTARVPARVSFGLLAAAMVTFLSGTARAERIWFDQLEPAVPGSSVSMLIRIADNTAPLSGYSLNVDVVPGADAVGMMVGNASASSFFPSKNLLAVGGSGLHPVLSVITDPHDNGVFFSAITADFSLAAPAVPGVSDVLGLVVFDVDPGAAGRFTIDLGPGSVLSNLQPAGVSFTVDPATVSIIPEPTTLLLLGTAMFATATAARRTHKTRRVL